MQRQEQAREQDVGMKIVAAMVIGLLLAAIGAATAFAQLPAQESATVENVSRIRYVLDDYVAWERDVDGDGDVEYDTSGEPAIDTEDWDGDGNTSEQLTRRQANANVDPPEGESEPYPYSKTWKVVGMFRVYYSNGEIEQVNANLTEQISDSNKASIKDMMGTMRGKAQEQMLP